MENFKLTWQSHSSTSSTLLVNLLNEQELTDLTLVSGDMKEVKAHQVMLGSVSPVLRKLFKLKSGHHICLYLAGTKQKDLLAMLNFIYVGEATISQDGIDSFFKIAKQFQIKGLANYSILPANAKDLFVTDNDIKDETFASLEDKLDNVEFVQEGPYATKNMIHPHESSDFEVQIELSSVNQDQEVKTSDSASESSMAVDDLRDISTKEDEDQGHSATNLKPLENIKIYKRKVKDHEVERIKPIADGSGNLKYHCDKCTYVSSTKDGLKRHLDFVHEGLKVICDQCSKIYASLSALRRHTAIEHRGKLSTCDMCDYQSKSSDSLKNHKLKRHSLF